MPGPTINAVTKSVKATTAAVADLNAATLAKADEAAQSNPAPIPNAGSTTEGK